jgi:glycosyltransferase involved in cell wall biosynthesis
MQNQNPKVTVIMPAFNREKYIAESMRSVLIQTFKDFELLVIDDGSTDKTVEIARTFVSDPRVRIQENKKNEGIAKTRNKGLELSKGKYIAPLDSDDIWLDHDKLSKQVEFLDTHANYAMIGGAIVHIDTRDNQLKKVIFARSDEVIRNVILHSNQFAQSTLMFRKDAILKCGGYSSEYVVCDDYNLWLCVGTKYSFANFPDIFTGYRIHGSNITRTKRLTAAREILEIVRNNRKNYAHARLGILKAYLRLILAYVRT